MDLQGVLCYTITIYASKRRGEKMASNQHIYPRHQRCYRFLYPIIWAAMKVYYGYRAEKFRIDEGKQYLILSNHQALLDPAFVVLSFNKMPYIIASDHLNSNGFFQRLLRWAFAPIYKHKAAADIKCIRTCLKTVKEGGSILLFPTGNRVWADYSFYVDPSVVKLIRMLKVPVLLYQLQGGYGVNPRWNHGKRRGPFEGRVVRELSVEEIAAMDDDTLYNAVVEGIRYVDWSGGGRYRSKTRAEYLERLLFLCPRCGKVETLRSEGAYVHCDSCGLKVEYGEDLLLHCEDSAFPYRRLVEWYNGEKHWVKEQEIRENAVIWQDDHISLCRYQGTEREEMGEITLTLTDKTLTMGELTLPVEAITAATIISGAKLVVTTEEDSYMLQGHPRFNAIKYVLMFNRLETSIKEDKYYSLDDEV